MSVLDDCVHRNICPCILYLWRTCSMSVLEGPAKLEDEADWIFPEPWLEPSLAKPLRDHRLIR